MDSDQSRFFRAIIQAVVDDEERGARGAHDRSAPKLLNVLNAPFLGDLPAKLEKVGDTPRKRLSLRNHLAKIRVFDLSGGSGSCLVIAYRDMRVIEAEMDTPCGEVGRRNVNLVMKFRGLGLGDVPAETARLA